LVETLVFAQPGRQQRVVRRRNRQRADGDAHPRLDAAQVLEDEARQRVFEASRLS